MNHNIKNIHDILPEVEKRILELFGNNVERIILFGSYARNDFNEASDVDLIVLVKDNKIEDYRKLRIKIISEFLITHEVLLSIRILNSQDFIKYKDTSPFLQNIVKEGVTFYG
uniref:Nucleotidyltransferase domain-containing protein n=1 Tax=Ignavibacterium album TaxID=591197 RepID=A0A7V3E6D0_9BACT